MRRLHPGPEASISIRDAYANPLGARSDAPWCGLSMVASIDGSTVVSGRSSELSSPNDSAVLRQLRAIADVIVVGAGTVRAEGYGPPSTQGQRVGVVTATGHVDTDTDLFRCGAGFIVTTTDSKVPDHVDVLRVGHGSVDFAQMLQRLDEVCDVPRVVQAEGGARLNGALLDADVLDEVNLTTSPQFAGGTGPRLTTGAPDGSTRYELAQLLVDDESFIYSRWRRHRSENS